MKFWILMMIFTCATSSQAANIPESLKIRRCLGTVFKSQQDYRTSHQKFAKKFNDLGPGKNKDCQGLKVKIQTPNNLTFQAEVDGPTEKWTIDSTRAMRRLTQQPKQ